MSVFEISKCIGKKVYSDNDFTDYSKQKLINLKNAQKGIYFVRIGNGKDYIIKQPPPEAEDLKNSKRV